MIGIHMSYHTNMTQREYYMHIDVDLHIVQDKQYNVYTAIVHDS